MLKSELEQFVGSSGRKVPVVIGIACVTAPTLVTYFTDANQRFTLPTRGPCTHERRQIVKEYRDQEHRSPPT